MNDREEKENKLYQLVVELFGEEDADVLYQRFLDESRTLDPEGRVRSSYAYVAMQRYAAEHGHRVRDEKFRVQG